jgi:uracil-DNA glycosylase family 4
MNKRSLIAAYLRQQVDLSLPDIPVSRKFDINSISQLLPAVKTGASARMHPAAGSHAAVFARAPAGISITQKKTSDRLAHVPRIDLVPSAQVSRYDAAVKEALTFEQKREVFKEIYAVRCEACPLAKTRHSFVFGAGNVDAPLMIIGEAPGADEDAQGLPFVGAAGQLLTELCASIDLDRKKDIFITNILKCRPPANRNPESTEIAACLPLLEKQISVIAPRLLLLLGRIAAHALLERPDSIAKLRAAVHKYRGIPVMVTYHPAAILRNYEYRKPTEDDFKRVQAYLKESR